MAGLLVVMDFDGTITVDDCLDAIFLRHTQGWPAVLERVGRLEVGRVAALREQVGKLRVPAVELVAEFAAEAQPRPGLGEFLRWLAAAGGRAAVVSLGFREGIEEVWRREGLPPVDLFASELRGDAGRLSIVPDDHFGDCDLCGPSACKAPVIARLRRPGDLVVVCGDGTADLCMARRADLTFARGRLAELCASEGLAWRPLVDFVEARAALAAWFAERTAG